jgi:hypothetical protein
MAIQGVNVSLRAYHREWGKVGSGDFIRSLQITDSDLIVEAQSDVGSSKMAVVALVETQISDYSASPEPYEAFAEAIKSKLGHVATWLDKRPLEGFDRARQEGLTVDLLVELWINDDQMELSFPSSFLAACGRLGLNIEMITND